MNLKQKAMIKALRNTLGVVTLACEVSGVSRSQHYKWMNCSEEYKNAVTDIEDIALDFAESKLHGLIKNNDTTATIFFLKTKGKRRGYIEKNEIGFTDKDGNDATAAVIYLPENGRNANQANNQTTAGVPGESTEQPG